MKWKQNLAAFFISILFLSSGTVTEAATASPFPVFSGGLHHYAIDQNGQLLAWGVDDYGLMFGGAYQADIQAPLTLNRHISSGTASQFSYYAIDQAGNLWGSGSLWGINSCFPHRDQPATNQPILNHVVMASAGFRHCLALRWDGSLWAWGMNNHGQTDYKTFDPALYAGETVSPRKIMDGVIYVDASFDGSYAITLDNTLWGWGSLIPANTDGSHNFPHPTKLMEDVAFISNGMVIKTDGALWQWPSSDGGEIAQEAVEVAKQVKFATCSGSSVFALIKEDNTLWTWGRENADGILGNGTTEPSSTPQKIMDKVSYVEFAGEHLLILKHDGTLWMTGCSYSDSEELPPAGRKPYYSPYPVMDGLASYQPFSKERVAAGCALRKCFDLLHRM